MMIPVLNSHNYIGIESPKYFFNDYVSPYEHHKKGSSIHLKTSFGSSLIFFSKVRIPYHKIYYSKIKR